MNSRTELLLGKEKLSILSTKSVIVFGIGGVGGYVSELLVRAGVSNITLVDFDVVDKTNINRQIIALTSTIGKPKVEVMKERLLDINPKLNVTALNIRYSLSRTHECFNKSYDYCIDAIDCVKEKVELIKYCHDNNINIVSAMGAGNRSSIPHFVVSDIYKTHNDGLAKVLRKLLKNEGIKAHNVVYTETLQEYKGDEIGSISYYPAMCGCVMSAFVLNELIK